MIAQMEDLTIPLFERQYPGHQAVFFFDNATNHAAYAEDALRTENLNLGPGGECNGTPPPSPPIPND